jgi:hypothetical protein
LKLLQKHSRSILVTNLLIMLLGGVLFYLMFNYLVDATSAPRWRSGRSLPT